MKAEALLRDRLDAARVEPRRLTRAELPADPVALARFLIGKLVGHDTEEGRTVGRVVETEAYVVGDAACHGFRGQTKRNRSLFLERGHAYVYLNYGIHYLLNISGESPGIGAGVLFRALEPVQGIGLMQVRRGKEGLIELARGPGSLSRALGVGPAQDGLDFCDAGSALWLAHGDRPPGEIGVSVRIGITKDADRPLRFYERRSPYVSGPRKLNR